MKKISRLIIVLLLSVFFLFSCKKDEKAVEQKALKPSNYNSYVFGNVTNNTNNLAYGKIYEELKKQDKKSLYDLIVNFFVEKNILVNGSQNYEKQIQWVNQQINKELDSYVEDQTYFVNNEFNEEFFGLYLESKLYDVNNNARKYNITNSKLTLNYDDFIQKSILPKIYEKLIFISYSEAKKGKVIDQLQIREVSYIKINDEEVDEDEKEVFDQIIEKLTQLENKEIESFYSIHEIFNTTKMETLDLDYQSFLKSLTLNENELNENDKDSFYNNYEKFTKCGEKLCSYEEAYQYQKSLINKEKELATKIYNKAESDLFSKEIRENLFNSNMEKNLYEINGEFFLKIPSDYLSSDCVSSIINKVDNDYYIIKVYIIDTKEEDLIRRYDGIKELFDDFSLEAAFYYYFDQYEMTFYEDYFKDQIREVFGE